MADLPLSSDFRSIVLGKTPLIDVRAPVEYTKGAFPGAVNLPLMDDEERRLVGIRYKEAGNAEAVRLGHQLVSGRVKEARIRAWSDFMDARPEAKLYCFRGGQRSKIAQEWLHEAGRTIVRLQGGYKAFRTFLMEEIERSPTRFSPIILGGRTGSGKTLLLQHVRNAVDLEAIANHRGSSFGRKITPQPTQINFETALAYALLNILEQNFRHLVFEDEGKNVGVLFLPRTFTRHLAKGPLVVLETPTQRRVEITFDEYVLGAQQLYRQAPFPDPLEAWAQTIRQAMQRIERRLGNQRLGEVGRIFESALSEQRRTGGLDAYRPWVRYLLEEYYDPMYDYQIAKRTERITFRGPHEAVLEHLARFA